MAMLIAQTQRKYEEATKAVRSCSAKLKAPLNRPPQANTAAVVATGTTPASGVPASKRRRQSPQALTYDGKDYTGQFKAPAAEPEMWGPLLASNTRSGVVCARAPHGERCWPARVLPYTETIAYLGEGHTHEADTIAVIFFRPFWANSDFELDIVSVSTLEEYVPNREVRAATDRRTTVEPPSHPAPFAARRRGTRRGARPVRDRHGHRGGGADVLRPAPPQATAEGVHRRRPQRRHQVPADREPVRAVAPALLQPPLLPRYYFHHCLRTRPPAAPLPPDLPPSPPSSYHAMELGVPVYNLDHLTGSISACITCRGFDAAPRPRPRKARAPRPPPPPPLSPTLQEQQGGAAPPSASAAAAAPPAVSWAAATAATAAAAAAATLPPFLEEISAFDEGLGAGYVDI